MPYLPNLIPEKDKVIPEYFHKQSTVGAKVKAPVAVGPILLGLLFLFIAIYFIRYAGFAALFGLLALFCTGAGKRWLENAGRFRMTGAARLVIYGIILAVSVPIYLAYQHQDEVDATDRLAEHQRAAKFTADSLRADGWAGQECGRKG